MESWCFDSLEKGYVSNETVSPSDSITVRTKNVLMGWEFKAPFSYENNCSTITTNILAPSQQTIEENPGFSEEGIAEMMRKQFPNDSVKNVLNNTNTNDPSGVGDIMNPSMVTSNAISGEDESSSKLSSSVVDSNSRESSLIDLKLGRFGDNNTKSSSPRTARILSSAESSTPTKRARAASLSSQTAYCQVYGCNKDLSSSKDYHKRHKVCEVHSKTAKVIVNGIEQRFCQQCSRFHLLGEFDDGKRSCRKRLAGHNERRRKPQVGFNSSRTGRSLHSYTAGSIGSKFQGTTPTAASFICQDILGSSGAEKYGANVWSRHIKEEDGVDCAQKSANNGINGQIPQKSILSPCLFEKQYPPVIDNLNNTGPGSVFGENVNQYPHEIVSRSLFQANSLGSEDVTLFDAASTVQGLPGISESGCALSLLSSQSQNSPGHSSGMHVAQHPGISSSPHYSMSEVSEKLFGVGSQGLTNGAQNSYPSYRVGSTGRNHLNAMPGLVNDDTVKSDFGNGILQGSEYMNVKDRLSCEDGTTIDLLQLSSQLHRVENQRQSVSVKQENEGFCRLRMT